MARRQRRARLIRGSIPPDTDFRGYPVGVLGDSGEPSQWGGPEGQVSWEELALDPERREEAPMACRIALGISLEEAHKRIKAFLRERGV